MHLCFVLPFQALTLRYLPSPSLTLPCLTLPSLTLRIRVRCGEPGPGRKTCVDPGMCIMFLNRGASDVFHKRFASYDAFVMPRARISYAVRVEKLEQEWCLR